MRVASRIAATDAMHITGAVIPVDRGQYL